MSRYDDKSAVTEWYNWVDRLHSKQSLTSLDIMIVWVWRNASITLIEVVNSTSDMAVDPTF